MITITNNRGENLEILKNFLFPGGEVGIKLEPENYKFFHKNLEFKNPELSRFTFVAHLHNSNDVIALAMVKNAFENLARKFNCENLPINLFIPYLPYARQDRVCVPGESFSLKVIGNFINSLNFNKVTILDPHSAVSEAVINNVSVINQLDIIRLHKAFHQRVLESDCLFIAPDAGSNKKVSELAKYFGHTDFIRADKLRNLATGEILETIIYSDDLNRKDIIIVDDLLDRGGTFMALAKVLREKHNVGKIILYITHGIFSGGFDLLFKNGIDEIYCTNSHNANFLGYLPHPPKLNILKLEEVIKV